MRCASSSLGCGFANVETFIASGNVIFDAPGAKPLELEERIAMELERVLGYPVATFVRSPGDLAKVVRHEPFAAGAFDFTKHALYIGFLGGRPKVNVVRKVVELKTPMDEFHIHGRELYWGARDGSVSPRYRVRSSNARSAWR